MTFLTDKSLHKAISEITKAKTKRLAVAFWGSGAETFVSADGDSRFICNLSMGGTNPFVIRSLPRSKVKQNDMLHAKVYIGDGKMVVGSANVSTNGLGFENAERYWTEAGFYTTSTESAEEWFDKLWSNSRIISDDDLDRAEVAWKMRQRSKPTLPGFETYEMAPGGWPLLTWWEDVEYDANEDEYEKQFGKFSPELMKRLDYGVDVDGPEDKNVLKPERWVFVWPRKDNGHVSKAKEFWWLFTGPYVEKSHVYKHNKIVKSAVIQSEQVPPFPFNIKAGNFKSAFATVMAREEFEQLRTKKYKSSWFTAERIRSMQDFWPAVKAVYKTTDQLKSDDS